MNAVPLINNETIHMKEREEIWEGLRGKGESKDIIKIQSQK